MKTTKPNNINYAMQYQLMRVSVALMPLMPEFIIKRYCALVTRHVDSVEEAVPTMHIDRYDMVTDWVCTADRIVRAKATR
jgi:hypothetical protein